MPIAAILGGGVELKGGGAHSEDIAVDARWPIPRMVCSTGKREQKEEICQRTHVAGTEEKDKGKIKH